jgi:predicted MFS family arabinose efflux permease
VLAALLLAAANPIIVFTQPFLEQHDVSVGLFGAAQAPMRIAGIVGAVAAYRIVATLGWRQTFIVAPLLIAGSYALLGGWGSLYAFGATAVIFFVHSMVMPLTSDYLNRRIPNNQRATILSLRQLVTSLAIVALQPGLGVIADHVSLSAVFWATGAFVAVTVPPALYLWLRADSREGDVGVVDVAAQPGLLATD